jgi:hypothetical protein
MNYLNVLAASIVEHPASNPDRHPVMALLPYLSEGALHHVLRQYSLFPQALLQYIGLAQRKSAAAGYQRLSAVLAENLAEEQGSLTDGKSHAALFTEGLEAALKISLRNTPPSAATAILLRTIRLIFAKPVAFTLGAMYAIEATAIEELKIVQQLVELATEGLLPPSLQSFFEMHLNQWEPEHEQALRSAIYAQLDASQEEEFTAGFQALMVALDAWWHYLLVEALVPASAPVPSLLEVL